MDVLDLKVTQYQHEIKLMTYRYPLPSSTVTRKGLVFFIHGYGGYCMRTGFWFKLMAEAGYEVYALDQRGFGLSEGERGFIESEDILYGDIYSFIFGVTKKYDIDM